MFQVNKVIILLRNLKFTLAILRSKEALKRNTIEQNLAMIQNIPLGIAKGTYIPVKIKNS